jgi:diguanylate cyclase (GGDEF)-like protein
MLKNIISNFINICILEIDSEGNIVDVKINTKKDFKPNKAKTVYNLFNKTETKRIEKLLNLGISQRKTYLELNPKYGVKEYADLEVIHKEEKIYAGVKFSNIEKEKEFEKRIEDFAQQAEEDKLTGLLNRHGYWKQVQRILQGQDPDRKLGIIMIDADNLKGINDSKGHIAGDQAIREIGAIIKNTIRQRDIAVRYGGDEFLIIVEELTGRYSTAYGLARRLHREISKSEKTLTTVSIGVHVVKVGKFTRYLDDKKELQKKWNETVKKADEMAYKAKQEGKDRVECSEDVKK